MIEYQNIFTTVQVAAPDYEGVPVENTHDDRTGVLTHSYLMGKLGDAQIGPIYLGPLGVAALFTGTIAFLIIGLNMFASVNWDPIEFVRQLFWLALEPPGPQYGLSFPPLNDGGWWLIAGAFLTLSIMLWWWRTFALGNNYGMGNQMDHAFVSLMEFVGEYLEPPLLLKKLMLFGVVSA